MTKLGWKVHTPSMLAEIVRNPSMGIMSQPIRIFADLLAQVATRAAAIDDPELNILMLRLTLYDVADPEKHTFEEIQAHYAAQEKRLKGSAA